MKGTGGKGPRPTRFGRMRWWRGTRRHDEPTTEPAHDQPWVPTSGLADRVRRSPRQ